MSTSKYPKEPCPVCNESISTHHLARGNHMKKHESESGGVLTINEPPRTPATVPVIPVGDELAHIKDPVTRERYKRAMLRQEARKASPEIFIGGTTGDLRRALVERYAPDCIAPRRDPRKQRHEQVEAVMHACFAPPKDADLMADRAYIPVLNEHGEHACEPEGGDMLWKIPTDQYDAVIRRDAKESDDRLPQKEDEQGLLTEEDVSVGKIRGSELDEKMEMPDG